MALPRPVRHLVTLLELLCVLVIAGVVCAAFFVPYVAGIGLGSNKAADKFLDTTCNLKESALDQTTSVYARDGKTLIATLFEDNRKSIPLAAIPVTVREALIDTEDRRFGSHHGVDVRGLARAALNESGGATQGASTLTQQLVKQIRYYQAGDNTAAQNAAIAQTVDRKIFEAKCALDLEKRYSKNQILEKYFNIAYFGEQSYGIFVAASTYFAKTPAQLTIPEAAVIAGLVKDPTLYDPFKNTKPARQRRDEVIQNMAEAGHITARQAALYKKSPIQLTTQSRALGAQGCSYSRDALISNVGFFCRYALEWLETTGGMSDRDLKTGGYKIVTSIDPVLQNHAQQSLYKQFPANLSSTIIQPAIDPRNGEILAMATSKKYDYGLLHQKNPSYTTNSLFKGAFSGSGSTFKYFTLIAALEAGIKPNQRLTTAGPAKQKYFPTNCPNGGKPPTHNAGNYAVTMNLRDATVKSSNTYFVGVEDQIFNCDLTTIVDTAQDLGMESLRTTDKVVTGRIDGLSVADGVKRSQSYNFTLGQFNTSALELAQAYGVAANDGIMCAPKPILSVSTLKGAPVAFKQPGCQRKMDSWVARTAVDILTGDTQTGTARKFFLPDFYAKLNPEDHLVAGKTGTNNASTCHGDVCKDNGSNSSLWFVGMTPTLVATSAIVNVAHPTATLDLPGNINTLSADETYGSFASKYWISSFMPTLAKQTWHWDAASQVPGSGDNVPSVIGMLPDDAEQKLRDAGYKPVRYPIDCGSGYPDGIVAYFAPPIAAQDGSVTYCVSDGKPLRKSAAPVLRKRTAPSIGRNGNPTSSPTSPAQGQTSPAQRQPSPTQRPTGSPQPTKTPVPGRRTTHAPQPTVKPTPTVTPKPSPVNPSPTVKPVPRHKSTPPPARAPTKKHGA